MPHDAPASTAGASVQSRATERERLRPPFGELYSIRVGAADVAEPVAVLVALQLADELSAAGSQAGDDGVDVFDGEGDMADARLK